MEPAKGYTTAAATAVVLIIWCALRRNTKMRVSDSVTHFKTGSIALLAGVLNVDHHFTFAHSAYTIQ